MKSFLIRWFVTTLAVFLTAHIIPGISYTSVGALLCASLLLGIVNALIRPVLLFLSLPLILLTMGFFILVVNALLLELVAKLVDGFQVESFWTAFFGSILIGFVSWILSIFFKDKDGKVQMMTRHSQIKEARGRVVDI